VTDKVVYLAFSNRETVAEGIDFTACKHCRNKTFTITHDTTEFPMVKCAACGAHIGRIGWAGEVA
jgi:predicted nucleic acid-binding Zn ribbon protein